MESWDDDDLVIDDEELVGKLGVSSSASDASSNVTLASTVSSSGHSRQSETFGDLGTFTFTKSAALMRDEAGGSLFDSINNEDDAFEDKSSTLKARVQGDTSNTILKASPVQVAAIHHLGNRKIIQPQIDEDDFDLPSTSAELRLQNLRTKASFASHLSDDVEEDARLVGTIRSRRPQKSSASSLSSRAEDDNADFEDGFDLPSNMGTMKLSQALRDSSSSKSKEAISHSRASSSASVSSSHSKSSASITSKSPTSLLLKAGRVSGISASGSSNPNMSGASDNDDFFDDIQVPTSFMTALNAKSDLQAILKDRLDRRAKLENLTEDDDALPSHENLPGSGKAPAKRTVSHTEKRSDVFEDGLVIEEHSFVGKSRSASGNDLHKQISAGPVTRSRQLLHTRGFAQAMTDALPTITGSPSTKDSLHKQAATRRQSSNSGLDLRSPPQHQNVTFPRRPASRIEAVSQHQSNATSSRQLRHKKSTPHLSQGSADAPILSERTRIRQLSRKHSMPSLLHMPSTSSLTDASHSTVTPASLAKAHQHPSATQLAKRRGSQPGTYSPPAQRSPQRLASISNARQRESSASPVLPPSRPSTPSATAAIRLTMPTLSSRAKIKAPTDSASRASAMLMGAAVSSRPGLSPTFASTSSLSSMAAQPSILRRPKRASVDNYGDGTELDVFDDLPTNKDKERRFAGPAPSRQRSTDAQISTPRARRSSTKRQTSSEISAASVLPTLSSQSRKKNGSRAQPQLIRQLGDSTTVRVEGGMTWNPAAKKWEGNENVLRKFENAMATSARPALISPYSFTSPSSGMRTNNISNLATMGDRMEGHMFFEGRTQRWINTRDAEDELDFGDDEADLNAADDAQRWTADADAVKLRGKASFTTASDGLAGSMTEDEFFAECKAAEARHKHEMRHWPTLSPEQSDNRDYLWAIRRIVMEQ